MAYQPFLIADFKTAKFIGLEPWLSPIDAFPVLINMHVNKGVLEKRNGYTLFAQMKHGSTAQTATAITGIKTYLKNGMPSLLIMDTERCNFYNPVDGTMTDISSNLTTPADIFSGSASDLFSFCNWQNIGYMTNNVNQIHKWLGRGNAVVPFNIQINTTDTKINHVDTCRFVFVKDDRLCLLDTVEFGDWCPQRLRYSPVLQTDFTVSGSGYIDAPTEQRISAAGFVGKNIVIYMEGVDGDNVSGSLWNIKSTGNSSIPYKWEKITDTDGCHSPYSGVELLDGLAAIGLTDVLFYDNYKIKSLNIPNIRDILTEFNNSYIRSVMGYNQKEVKHLLFTFADINSSNVNRILDYNILENNWTIHKSAQSFFINCIGGFTGQKVPTMSELDDVIASDGALVSAITVDSRAVLGSPAAYTLLGCRNSCVYKWNDGSYDGTDDANGKIEIDCQSSEWNPFIKNSQKAALEYVKFYLDNDSTASFTVSLYKNTSSTAYKTIVVSCNGSNDKFWKTVYADGEVGDFHKLKISHTEKGNRPRIHAILLSMNTAGYLDL